jgi:prolyl 4-hydroxylase
MQDTLTPDWQQWLQHNLARGCGHRTILDAMLNGGVDPLLAARALVNALDPNGSQIISERPSTAQPFLSTRLGSNNRIQLGDIEARLITRLLRPDLAVFENVLSAAECEELMQLSRSKLERSTAINKRTGTADVIAERTSEGTSFQRGEHPLITRIDARLGQLLNWPVENGEGLQILRYRPGGEYRPHFDFFPPTDSGSATHMAIGGQRVATLVMYLNDVEQGGATDFPDIGLSVLPRQGCAVYFAYTGPFGQVDPLSLHAGLPVIAGEKWIATKWLRQHRYGD